MHVFHNKVYYYFLFFLSVFILLFPTNQNIYFDGLLLDKKLEHFLFLIFLPLLFLFKLEIRKFQKKLIVLLILFKILIIFFPNKGIKIDQYLLINNNDLLTEINVKNIDGIWSKNFSSSVYKDLNKSKEFPIEWINYHNPKNGILGEHHYCEVDVSMCNNTYPKLENFLFKFVLDAEIIIKNKSHFYFIAKGSKNSDLKLISKKNEIINIQTYTSEKYVDYSNLDQIEKGIYKLTGYIIFKGNQLSFLPKIHYNEKVKSAFSEKIIYKDKINSFYYDGIINLFSISFNILLIFILFTISVNFIISLNKNISLKRFKYFYYILFSFCLVLLLLKIFPDDILLNITSNESVYDIFSGSFILSFYILFILIYFFYFIKSNSQLINKNNLNYFFNFFVIFVSIIFFYYHWNDAIYNFSIQSQGDDWYVFQYFAYRINTLKEYIRAGEDVIAYRPLSRYIFSFMHSIFGQSFFSHKITDSWSILLSGLLVFKILKYNKLKIEVAFGISCILIIFYFGETFKFLIGRGLSAYYASVAMIYVSYLLSKYNQNLSINKIIFVALVGIIGIWFREDHLFAIFALGLIIYSNFNSYNKTSLLSLILDRRSFYLILYFFILFIGFTSIFFRNYYVGGQFFYGSNLNPNVTFIPSLNSLPNIYTILTGSELPSYPRTMAIFLTSSVILSFYVIFLKEKKANLICYSIIVLSIVFPYLFMKNPGYAPRFSVHMLPYSFIFLSIFFKNFINRLI